MQSITRRRFLEDPMLVAAAAVAGVAMPLHAQENKPGNANNRIRVAILGCRIRGKNNVDLEQTKLTLGTLLHPDPGAGSLRGPFSSGCIPDPRIPQAVYRAG